METTSSSSWRVSCIVQCFEACGKECSYTPRQGADRGTGIENLTSNQDEFFAYYEPYSADSFRKAVNDLQDYISAEGPFDAIIAFSQGASLAAALLLEMQLDAAMSENPRPKPVSCAIFFAGRLPYVDAASGQTVDSRHTVAEDAVIDMPTAHIWGANDDLEPGQPQALAKICKSEDMFTFIHEGGHDIPGAGNDEAVTGTIRAIRRALDQIDS